MTPKQREERDPSKLRLMDMTMRQYRENRAAFKAYLDDLTKRRGKGKK